MDTKYWTKRKLYQAIDDLIDMMGISMDYKSYPLHSIEIAHTFCHNLTLSTMSFPTTAICGILCKDDDGTSIALNIKRDKFMQNFDCMHELIHYFLHDGNEFNCTEKTRQNKFLEWQANEGAAQALVPYQLFIPKYVSLSRKYARNFLELFSIPSTLAAMFNVTSKIIRNRINNLEYEIYQYISGKPITEIQIISNKKAKEYGYEHIAHHNYCINCLGIVNENHHFCHICGKYLKNISPDGWFYATLKGVGYMKYSGIQLDTKFKAVICPRCDNEEIHPEGNFCKICRTNLINICTGDWECDAYGNYKWIFGCNAILEGNSRYCPFCGKKSSFLQHGFLSEWNYDPSVPPI